MGHFRAVASSRRISLSQVGVKLKPVDFFVDLHQSALHTAPTSGQIMVDLQLLLSATVPVLARMIAAPARNKRSPPCWGNNIVVRCSRLCSSFWILTLACVSWNRCEMSRLSSRKCSGGTHTSGTRFAASKWAKLSTSIRSVLTRAAAMSLTFRGWANDYSCHQGFQFIYN